MKHFVRLSIGGYGAPAPALKRQLRLGNNAFKPNPLPGTRPKIGSRNCESWSRSWTKNGALRAGTRTNNAILRITVAKGKLVSCDTVSLKHAIQQPVKV